MKQAAKKAALKGTSGTALRKVRTSVTFHRCVLTLYYISADGSEEERPARC